MTVWDWLVGTVIAAVVFVAGCTWLWLYREDRRYQRTLDVTSTNGRRWATEPMSHDAARHFAQAILHPDAQGLGGADGGDVEIVWHR